MLWVLSPAAHGSRLPAHAAMVPTHALHALHPVLVACLCIICTAVLLHVDTWIRMRMPVQAVRLEKGLGLTGAARCVLKRIRTWRGSLRQLLKLLALFLKHLRGLPIQWLVLLLGPMKCHSCCCITGRELGPQPPHQSPHMSCDC